MEELLNSFDDKVKVEAIRMQLGLTRKDFCQQIGVSEDRYSRIINGNGRMTAFELQQISKVGHVPADKIEINY